MSIYELQTYLAGPLEGFYLGICKGIGLGLSKELQVGRILRKGILETE